MDYMVKGIFVIIPLSCATVVAGDIWMHGLRSLPLQFALGIAALFFAVKLAVMAVGALDAVIEAARPMMASVRAFFSGIRGHVSDVPARISALGRRARTRSLPITS
jgi:hypothetical protein